MNACHGMRWKGLPSNWPSWRCRNEKNRIPCPALAASNRMSVRLSQAMWRAAARRTKRLATMRPSTTSAAYWWTTAAAATSSSTWLVATGGVAITGPHR